MNFRTCLQGLERATNYVMVPQGGTLMASSLWGVVLRIPLVMKDAVSDEGSDEGYS